MTRTIQAPAYWTRTQFWTIAAILFAAQVGLIWIFAARGARAPLPQAPDFAVRFLVRPFEQGQLATALFAEDPTLFQAPAQRGFSGRAWMNAPSPEYHAADARTPDVYLSLGTGVWKPRALPAPAPHEAPLTIRTPEAPDGNSDSPLTEPASLPKASFMRMEGALAGRRVVSRATPLPAQPAVQLLSNSVVQLGVNSAGEVTSARLQGTSGSTAADATALDAARRLRFAPDAAPRGAIAWGTAVFSWETVEPAAAK